MLVAACPLRQGPAPHLAPARHPTWLVNSNGSNGVDTAVLHLPEKLATLFREWLPKEPSRSRSGAWHFLCVRGYRTLLGVLESADARIWRRGPRDQTPPISCTCTRGAFRIFRSALNKRERVVRARNLVGLTHPERLARAVRRQVRTLSFMKNFDAVTATRAICRRPITCGRALVGTPSRLPPPKPEQGVGSSPGGTARCWSQWRRLQTSHVIGRQVLADQSRRGVGKPQLYRDDGEQPGRTPM